MAAASEDGIRISTDKLIEFKPDSARKIPKARFYEDISELVEGKLELIGPTLQAYDDIHRRYQMMTQSLNQQLASLEDRQRNLKEALEVIESTKARVAGSQVLYKVSDCLYAKAKITDPSKCLLWLGSNVMIETAPEEASEIINSNLKLTEENIDDLVENILALRAETTVIEAGMSRLHNYGVYLRQASPQSA